ncbi:GPI mannosyltransferase [Planoprotostelium fungivorum]|uniref:GPI mannosyltransferase 2 n=1 Tax=Planoprotostelium fungivorum TaxID=1890364 RepID=A0A2P6NAH1_9EUKA|nr:GPI mannosyltransferase [Planoprotostelium fungivorum]
MLPKTTGGEYAFYERKVIWLAVSSRVVLYILSFLLNDLVNDYDTSTELFAQDEKTSVIMRLFGHLMRWDAIHLLGIAKEGYIYEHTHAFFPFYPLSVHSLSKLIINFIGSYSDSILLSSVIISNLFFVLSTIALYRLSVSTTEEKSEEDYDWAYRVCFLLCLSPANIFFLSPYTETMFMFFTLMGLYGIIKDRRWLASLFFSLSGAVRSNAVLYCGFFVWNILRDSLLHFHQGDQKRKRYILRCFESILQVSIVFVPFLLYQFFVYQRFCQSEGEGTSPWCQQTVPSSYSYIQEKYWNQGFLRYWTIKQIPNFALAAPMMIVSFYGSFHFLIQMYQSHSLMEELKDRVNGRLMIPLHVYWAAFTFIVLFFFHVQTITRFFASIPCLYWTVSRLISEDKGSLPVFWFLLYNILGLCLYTNFYPWT